MKNPSIQPPIIGIRREDLSKTGEERVAVVPEVLSQLPGQWLVQPGMHPTVGENKRAFPDSDYQAVGATISENLAEAEVIFGLKEVEIDQLLQEKAYLFFSHTHKGQVKNRPLLKAMVERKISLIDYELITNERDRRIVTAFTFFAGYAGMTDTLWTLSQRWTQKGISHPFGAMRQAIGFDSLEAVKQELGRISSHIQQVGTPADRPPLITVFLGDGKTSTGAQEIYDHLPVETINMDQLADTYAHGSRKKVYKLVLNVSKMYRPKADSPIANLGLEGEALFQQYLKHPDYFETNLDKVYPYTTIWMNCILWAPKYPRLISREQAAEWYQTSQNLEVIGDITCDPEGAIHFSQETWIDEPVFIYNPERQENTLGMKGPGIAVMAVTNLPCEFAADASRQFSADIEALLPALIKADFEADSPQAAGFPPALQRATILWKGNFTPDYQYMSAYCD